MAVSTSIRLFNIVCSLIESRTKQLTDQNYYLYTKNKISQGYKSYDSSSLVEHIQAKLTKFIRSEIQTITLESLEEFLLLVNMYFYCVLNTFLILDKTMKYVIYAYTNIQQIYDNSLVGTIIYVFRQGNKNSFRIPRVIKVIFYRDCQLMLKNFFTQPAEKKSFCLV